MRNNVERNVSIVILNYNGYIDTIACFESLSKISYENYNIIIVDNASPDGSMNQLVNYMNKENINNVFFKTPESAMESTQRYMPVNLIQSGYNTGYGHGNNIGIKYALKNATDYVLVLNNDTVVKPDFLEPMVQMCEEDENIGIASGKIYFYDRPDVIWFNGGTFSVCTARVRHLYFKEKDVGQIPLNKNTFISGCLWLIPAKVFKKVGYINEEYFMYMEDLEFSQRVLNNGYSLKVNQESTIFHKAGSSSGGHWSEFSIYWMGRNGFKFINSNVNGVCKQSAYIFLLFLKPIKWLKHGRFRLIKKHFEGIIDGIKS